MSGLYLNKLLRLRAALVCVGAAGRKAAARLGIDGRCYLPLHGNRLHGLVDIRGGDRGQQRLGLGMQRARKQTHLTALFNELP